MNTPQTKLKSLDKTPVVEAQDPPKKRIKRTPTPRAKKISPTQTTAPIADISAQINEALAAHQAQNFDQAIASYEAILKQSPQHFDALHLLAVAQFQTGNARAALTHIEQATSLNPAFAQAHINHGIILESLQRPKEALIAYEKALTLEPHSAEAFFNYGNALYSLHRLEAALFNYDQALLNNPKHAATLFNRGNVLRELNQLTQALESYNRALVILPNTENFLQNRDNVLREIEYFNKYTPYSLEV